MKTLVTRGIQALMVAVLIGAATFAMMRSLPGDAAYRIAAGRYDRVRLHLVVVLLEHRPSGGDVGTAEQLQQNLRRRLVRQGKEREIGAIEIG